MCMLEPTDNCEECMYVWQMSYLLVSMRLGLPEGVDYYKVAKYSPTGATGTEERHSLWLSIVAAMFECGGLGRHRTLAGYITAYEYSMTDPTRALAFGRMWTKHGVEISETKSANLAKSPSKSVSGKVMATGETMVLREKIVLAALYKMLAKSHDICMAKTAEVLNKLLCTPADESTANVSGIQEGTTPWSTARSCIASAGKRTTSGASLLSPEQRDFVKCLPYFDGGECKCVCICLCPRAPHVFCARMCDIWSPCRHGLLLVDSGKRKKGCAAETMAERWYGKSNCWW